MKRRVSLPGKCITTYPKWRSLKVGDVVMTLGLSKVPCVLLSVQSFKKKWSSLYTVYWKDGTFLNLETGDTFVVSLDDIGIRGQIIRAEQEKKGILGPSEGLSLRDGS